MITPMMNPPPSLSSVSASSFSHAPASRTIGFGESVIRETTRLAKHYGALNLAQGLPNLPAPQRLKDLACQAIEADHNQYAFTWGLAELRQAICQKHQHFYGQTYDPQTDVVISCGSSEAMISTLMAWLEPGDEVIIFEPIYENYLPDSYLNGAKPVIVSLHPPEWTLDEAALKQAFSDKTKAIVLNTPNNPTGKVFTKAELQLIADLCQQYDVLCVTDEIYEHMVYDGLDHVPMASLEGMAERTITVTGFSKTFCVTGWRVGYAIGPASLIGPVRKVHDYSTIAAPTPLQVALAQYLQETMQPGHPFYDDLRLDYVQRRDRLVQVLANAGFTFQVPGGAYYIFADYSAHQRPGGETSLAFSTRLIKDAGVTCVPGLSFYRPEVSDHFPYVRFCFPKTYDVFDQADQLLQAWINQKA